MVEQEKKDKVEELVEWAAKKIHLIVVSFAQNHGKESPNPQWENLRETAREHYCSLALEILSHPNLALIDREDETYSAALITGAVIPLAEAVKGASND